MQSAYDVLAQVVGCIISTASGAVTLLFQQPARKGAALAADLYTLCFFIKRISLSYLPRNQRFWQFAVLRTRVHLIIVTNLFVLRLGRDLK